jgi:hypothetical protein
MPSGSSVLPERAGSIPYRQGVIDDADLNDITTLYPHFAVLGALRRSQLHTDLAWVFPDHLLPGVRWLHAVPIRHGGVDRPYLAHTAAPPPPGCYAQRRRPEPPIVTTP